MMSFLAAPAAYIPELGEIITVTSHVAPSFFLLPLIASARSIWHGSASGIAHGVDVMSLRTSLHAHAPKLQLLILGHAFHVIDDVAHSDISVSLPRRRVEYSSVARFKYGDTLKAAQAAL